VARWGRASRLLTVPPGSRVLDLGCAFGFGTRLLARRFRVEGRDLSAEYVRRARIAAPNVSFTCGPAGSLPYPENHFQAVALLDVLEHVPDGRAVVDEVARVLQPDGELVLSTPNRGLLAKLDSLNLYQSIFRGHGPAPTDDPSWSVSPHHRHYSLEDLEAMLRPWFAVEAVQYTGVGLAEIVNLMLLVVVLRLARAPRLFGVLQYLYFGVYILEDELSIGRLSYHVMIRARRIGVVQT
jgi:2-polyprenyl-3-methyl-5-hydroxy-6-metoxy-1,4-benzoquinol methylase